MNTFLDAEFVKERLKAVAKDIFPDKSKRFSNLRPSRQTVCRLINDISNEIIVKPSDRIRDLKYFSLEFDKSTDISDKAQSVVFACEVN